jgi:hypothetical protein
MKNYWLDMKDMREKMLTELEEKLDKVVAEFFFDTDDVAERWKPPTLDEDGWIPIRPAEQIKVDWGKPPEIDICVIIG